MKKQWIGNVPAVDDMGKAIPDRFIDGKTVHGPWAIMSPESFRRYGVGLGTGKGQEYTKDASGRWIKTGG